MIGLSLSLGLGAWRGSGLRWFLASGTWNDAGVWDDAESWE